MGKVRAEGVRPKFQRCSLPPGFPTKEDVKKVSVWARNAPALSIYSTSRKSRCVTHIPVQVSVRQVSVRLGRGWGRRYNHYEGLECRKPLCSLLWQQIHCEQGNTCSVMLLGAAKGKWEIIWSRKSIPYQHLQNTHCGVGQQRRTPVPFNKHSPFSSWVEVSFIYIYSLLWSKQDLIPKV